ncbi:MAG: FAD-dependent oxidoreductase [Deltaproteobacteria bacterium]|nr:FAD-dependent oxidoreductase [Deltaproteobacteria bacterium]
MSSPSLRTANVRRLTEGTFDVLIVGGGINGAVSAACLAGQGARVALIDKSDFASFTSQQSSNLAWGGIKYMETLEFGLVRKLCVSRNHLIRSYPSTVQEIRFFVLHEKTFRHGLWKLVLGTWLYWFIGSFFTKRPRRLSKATIEREEPIVATANSDGGFEYSDAYFHDTDTRFVWNFVRGALNYGCIAANYVESLGSERGDDGLWVTRARDAVTGHELSIRSKVVVNACGPFVDEMNGRAGQKTQHRHLFSKGIHLIVPRLTKNRRVLTFFADDGRLFFVIPMGPRTCIGTTDTRVDSPITHVTDDDRKFVLDNINKRLNLPQPLTEKDIVAERCGVRPLVVSAGQSGAADWTQLSRKHAIEVDERTKYVSIFGGKLTDCLNVGREVAAAVHRLGVELPYPEVRWYGEPDEQTRREFFHQARLMRLDDMTPKSSSEPLSTRLWRRYGEQALALLEDIRADPTMAELVVERAEYVKCEITQAARREMIVTLDDFLRRRSKIALVLHKDVLREAPGVREVCRILFGDKADARYEEYFGAPTRALPARGAQQESAATGA